MKGKTYMGQRNRVIQGVKSFLFYIMILSAVEFILGNALSLYVRKYMYKEETKVIYELKESVLRKDIGLAAKIKKF